MKLRNDNAGDWRGLDSSEQIPRYTAIAEILRSHNVDRNVLDVGCGEGLLRVWLPEEAVYTGIEPSSLAAASAAQRNPSGKIIHTNAENFDSKGQCFDSIVFSEVLYYAADPVGLLRQYVAMLSEEGVVLLLYLSEARPNITEAQTGATLQSSSPCFKHSLRGDGTRFHGGPRMVGSS